MRSALVLLAAGFEEIEALTAVDVLRRGGVRVTTAAVGRSLSVRGAHGVTVTADAFFDDVANRAFDALVLPGGGEGTDRLKASPSVLARVRRQSEEGGLLCAICAAPTVLAAAGVLGPDAHVTCYPSCEEGLALPSAGVPVVADGNVITGQAPGASLLFALVVLKHLTGEDTAYRVADGLVTDVL